MKHDIVERLRVDPGLRTLGQLIQEREAAALEIERLRAQIERFATGLSKQSPEPRVKQSGPKSPTNSNEAAFRPGSVIRLVDVCRFLSISRSTIYKRLSEDAFPAPVRLGPHTVRWRIEDVEAWRDRAWPAAK